MKFKIEIELGNDAMLTNGDVAQALRRTADKLDDYDKPTAGEGGRVMDRNGQPVGRWGFWR